MKTNKEIARDLIAELAKEVPCLAEVQRLCEKTFEDLCKEMITTESEYSEQSKILSTDSAKAAFIAVLWWINQNPEMETTDISNRLSLLSGNEDLAEAVLLLEIFVSFLEIQFIKDPSVRDNIGGIVTS